MLRRDQDSEVVYGPRMIQITRDTVIAPNTPHAIKVPRPSMVLTANLSAMFDRLRVGDPNAFHSDRSRNNYIYLLR